MRRLNTDVPDLMPKHTKASKDTRGSVEFVRRETGINDIFNRNKSDALYCLLVINLILKCLQSKDSIALISPSYSLLYTHIISTP